MKFMKKIRICEEDLTIITSWLVAELQRRRARVDSECADLNTPEGENTTGEFRHKPRPADMQPLSLAHPPFDAEELG